MSSENISALIASLQGNGAVNGLNADISFPGSTVTNENDLVTKTYVDNVAAGLDVRGSCRVATTENITIATALNNGDSIDGVSLDNDDRVLVKNQSTAKNNGIYIVGAPPARSTDLATGSSAAGIFTFIEEGSTNADKGFVCTTNSGSDVVNTNDLAFTQFSGVSSTVPVDKGGTGATTLTNGGILLGSGSGAITAMAVLTDGQMIVGDGSTDPVAESGATLRTSIGLGTTSDVQFHDTRVDSLGVGTAVSGTTGEIRATNDITAFYSSDKRLKDNIKKIQDPLDKLDYINGYTFDWIEKEGIHSNKGHDIGVIAQEIEEVLPEVTTTRDNGYKAVRYEKIVPLLIECIKDQQKQINKLKDEINLLKK